MVASDRTGVGHRPGEVRERELDLARRRCRGVATPAYGLSIVRGQAVRDRRAAVSHRPHDRLPDRRWRGGARGVAAALTLVRRREVAGVRGRAGVARAPTDPRLVVGLGSAQRTLERPGQDLRGMCLAVGARSGALRRPRGSRRGARRRPAHRPDRPSRRRSLRLRRASAHCLRRRGAREGDGRSRARPDRSRRPCRSSDSAHR